MADDLPNWNLNILDPMDDDSKSRFIEVSKDDVDELIAQLENENMKKKTMYDMNTVLKFLARFGMGELNVYFSEFVIAGRTKKGEKYEPSSLRRILTSVDRYLTRREWENLRLFIDPQFTRLRDALKVKEKELIKQSRGNKPNATSALSQKWKLIFSLKKKVLGTSSPQSLLIVSGSNKIQLKYLNTLYLYFSLSTLIYLEYTTFFLIFKRRLVFKLPVGENLYSS